MSNIHLQDVPDNNNEDFYTSFKEKLMSVEQFPTFYTFKFIVPADPDTKTEIEKIFVHPSTKVQVKDSKTGKYNSLTIETFVNTADEVIDYYKRVATIKNVIML
ncbi:DUF493 domain-containing protein [Parapedobacter sp. SGR-10]|uniref:DUF493 domain-containing protein n=1 Tax=Parapedobacter sp. SGR-10 TaxID=2710879 RepID=UPI0013D513F5|nr:DUF493 domain-containing protein [Parapedobacter sp. SGR-10]NGF57698.1 DUF493 domain-containing protein [Parapedobacter sp. SGR-10]